MFRLFVLCVAALALLAARPGAAAEPPAIMVFGDSLSAGYGLPRGKGWVDLLQERLQRERYPYRVVNASVSGETTLGGRNRLAAALTQHRPHIVILELGSNDALRGQPLDTMRDNLVAMVRECRSAHAQVLLVGMRIPPNYGPEYTGSFQASFAAVADKTRSPLVDFLLAGFAERRERFQADGIHPDVDAQSFMLDNVWKKLQPMLNKSGQ